MAWDALVKKAFEALNVALTEATVAFVDLAKALDQAGQEPPEPLPITLKATEVSLSTVKVEWETERQDVQGWKIQRDGEDIHGSGPWSTELPSAARNYIFSSLKPGTKYTFTLTPRSALGSITSVIVQAITKSDTTVPPTPGTGNSYAAKLGWGEPNWRDEFDYEGDPKSNLWMPCGKKGEGWTGHAGNGRRMPECTTVKDGMLVMTGKSNGHTGWLRALNYARYGRVEWRSRSRNTGPNGDPYHVLGLWWPTEPEAWPDNGELDVLEYMNPDGKQAGAYLHYPHRKGISIQQEGPLSKNCDMTQWNTFNVEWNSTGVRSWINGEKWYDVRDGGGPQGRKNIQDMTKGMWHFQLDNFSKNGPWRPAVIEVDFVRFYPVK